MHDQLNAQYAGATGNNSALPGTAQGGQDAFVNLREGQGSIKTSDIATTVQANTQYVLTVALGNRLDANPGTNLIALTVNGNRAAFTQVPATSLPEGTFTDFVTVLGPLLPSDSRIGGTLGIELFTDAGSFANQVEGNFDNVRLTAAVPEPASGILLIVPTFAAAMRRRRRLYQLNRLS